MHKGKLVNGERNNKHLMRQLSIDPIKLRAANPTRSEIVSFLCIPHTSIETTWKWCLHRQRDITRPNYQQRAIITYYHYYFSLITHADCALSPFCNAQNWLHLLCVCVCVRARCVFLHSSDMYASLSLSLSFYTLRLWRIPCRRR